jgi:hypothetical protein
MFYKLKKNRMRSTKKIVMVLTAVILVFAACSKEDEEPNGLDGKAKIENLAVSPTTNLKYGDAVTLTGVLSDETGLHSYTLKISNGNGDIYEKSQMLTGKTFNLNEELLIPLPPNAVAGNLTISLTVKNSGDRLTDQEIELKNVTLPNFAKLYLVLNGTAYEMTKKGDVFEFEDFVPAGATGKIYANADQTGIFWGWEENTVKVMAANDIPFGRETEEYFKISFNAVSFSLETGDPQTWNPMTTDVLYILGTISGHWEDGDISVEKNKMKMSGFSLGNRKMWTWEPPNTGTGLSDDDMWGNTVAGVFRLKKAGIDQYILYSGGQIVTGADNKENSFVVSAAGQFNIRVMADEKGINSVKVFDSAKSLEYKNGEVLINGVAVTPSIGFAGTPLNLLPGNYFVYQGTFELTNDQSVTGSGINLASLYADVDLFSGSGNSTWKFIGPTSSYYFRIDAFSGHVYVREETGYPNTIYLDGWCWKKHPNDPRSNWDPATATSLYRKAGTNIYEATIFILPWNGDFKLWAASETNPDFSKMVIKAKYFENIDPMDAIGIKFPTGITDPGAYYKISVDLKDGFTFDKENLDEDNYTIVPANGKKFTLTFTPL